MSKDNDDLPQQFVSLLYNLKAYLLQGSSQDKDDIYFQYHIGRVLKLIHKLLEKDDVKYSSAIVSKCFINFKQVLQIMKDYASRKLSGKYDVASESV